MRQDTQYDVLIIGSGIAGYTAAFEAAQNGLSTAIIEKKLIGGTCLNTGCIPIRFLRNRFHGESTYGVDALRILEEKKSLLREGIQNGFLKSVDIIQGIGSFVENNRVIVEEKEFSAHNILIAVGTAPALPSEMRSIKKAVPITEFLNDFHVADDIVIVGAGIAGVEIASVLHDAGVENIIIIEKDSHINTGLWPETDGLILKELNDMGIDVKLDCVIKHAEEDEQRVYVFLDCKEVLEADFAIVACGGKADVEGVKLEKTGVILKEGFIETNEKHLTSVDGIYAIGDSTGGIRLAHKARIQAINAINDIVGKPAVDENNYPIVVHLHKQIACVGKSFEECKKSGINAAKVVYRTANEGAFISDGEPDGIVKIIYDASSKVVLGAMVYSIEAENLINTICLGISLGMKLEDLKNQIFFHPSCAEALTSAARNALYES